MGTSSYTSRLEDIFGTNTVSQADQETLKGWLTTYSADTIVCPSYTLGTSTATTMLNINALVIMKVHVLLPALTILTKGRDDYGCTGSRRDNRRIRFCRLC